MIIKAPKLEELMQQLIALPSISCTSPALDQGNRNVINTLANWLENRALAQKYSRSIAMAARPT